jgi:serine/threonine protein kinase
MADPCGEPLFSAEMLSFGSRYFEKCLIVSGWQCQNERARKSKRSDSPYFRGGGFMVASEELLGRVVQGQRTKKSWTVVERVSVEPGQTPGGFSIGYAVEAPDGERLFLKASDLGMFVQDTTSILDALNRATRAHTFEREILEHCRGNNMDRVITAVDYGEIPVVHGGTNDVVFFLVFELAQGDLRRQVTQSNSLSLLWSVTALHNVFVATSQLHAAQIAHNDLKPSNALIIDEEIQKVADLGRATSPAHPASHDAYLCAGDTRFAPPEQLYPTDLNCAHLEREDRRKVGDLYNLGSLTHFVVTSRMVTPEILMQLRPEIRPRNTSGGSNDSYQNALPYWTDALSSLLAEFVPTGKGRYGTQYEHDLVVLREIISQLCEPDPLRRGHPQNRLGHQDRYGLNRYISTLAATKAKLRVKAT